MTQQPKDQQKKGLREVWELQTFSFIHGVFEDLVAVRESLTSWSVSIPDPVPAVLTGPSEGGGAGGLEMAPLS